MQSVIVITTIGPALGDPALYIDSTSPHAFPEPYAFRHVADALTDGWYLLGPPAQIFPDPVGRWNWYLEWRTDA